MTVYKEKSLIYFIELMKGLFPAELRGISFCLIFLFAYISDLTFLEAMGKEGKHMAISFSSGD